MNSLSLQTLIANRELRYGGALYQLLSENNHTTAKTACKIVPNRMAMQLQSLLGPYFKNEISSELLILPNNTPNAFTIDLSDVHYLIMEDKQVVIDPATTYSICGDLHDSSGRIVMFADHYNAIRGKMHLVNKINDNVTCFIAEFLLEAAHMHMEWANPKPLTSLVFASFDKACVAKMLGVWELYQNAINIPALERSTATPGYLKALEEKAFKNYVMTNANEQAMDEVAHSIKRSIIEMFPEFSQVYLCGQGNAQWGPWGVYDAVVIDGVIHFVYMGDYRIIDWTLNKQKACDLKKDAKDESECQL